MTTDSVTLNVPADPLLELFAEEALSLATIDLVQDVGGECVLPITVPIEQLAHIVTGEETAMSLIRALMSRFNLAGAEPYCHKDITVYLDGEWSGLTVTDEEFEEVRYSSGWEGLAEAMYDTASDVLPTVWRKSDGTFEVSGE